MITPGQIAENLQVSSATVRRWSARFASYLSPQTPGKKRSYTANDLAVLSRVRDLTKNGLTLSVVAGQLAVMDQPAQSTALITLTDFAKSLNSVLDHVAILSVRIEKQAEWIALINDWFALPWHKRIGKKPPKFD